MKIQRKHITVRHLNKMWSRFERCYSCNRRRCKLFVNVLLALCASYIILGAIWNLHPSNQTPKLRTTKSNLDIKRWLMSDMKHEVSEKVWDVNCENCNPSVESRPTVYARTQISCKAMFESDTVETRRAEQHMNSHEAQTLSDDDYTEMASDCSSFRRSRGYFPRPLSQSEADFPIAFSILMYSDVQQVERLLRAIYMPQNYYCIHIDLKSSESTKRAVTAITNCFDNVFIASRLESVYWGHISIMYAEMNCLRDLLMFQWKYFINLSGLMFPAHSNAELVQILRLYDGANDIEGSYNRSTHFYMLFRSLFSWRLAESLGTMLITVYPKGRAPHNVTIYKGSNQVAITRAFAVHFIYSHLAQDIVTWFADTLAPDEYIWPTLNHNPHLHVPGAYKGDPELKTFTARATIWAPIADQINWSWDDWECRGKWVRQICIFGVGDLPWLYHRPELFINKFHSRYQWLTYDCMEELIYNRTLDTNKAFDTVYYEKLPFVKNKTGMVTSVSEAIDFLK